ncbi:Uncharacterized protein M6B38_230700 [Iris pallida]|uniref:O-fucosyltransferase family protein n=1 Tax=Iris pallida TaxID=29817 RepID=A0AAX6DS65_IRIPA|nr:Uncharacterized protein M6B38_230700 [Iris pallida]
MHRPAMSFRPENLGPNALRMVGNLCFALFVLCVLLFTLLAATYHPDDPLLHPSTSKLTSFLTSASNSTFVPDDSSALRTGEDFLNSSTAVDTAEAAINISDLNNTDLINALEPDQETTAAASAEHQLQPDREGETTATTAAAANPDCNASPDDPIDCKLPEVYHLMMRSAIEQFRDIHFYRFGKPSVGSGDGRTCDMAWRFRPKDAKRAGFYKDYRRFEIARSDNCTYSVVSIGEYHTGVNARKRKKGRKSSGSSSKDAPLVPDVVPEVGEAVNDTLPVVESENSFSAGKYLIYAGGGDRCKSMNHYLWSFLCALGEAQYLNRTLVMDLSICLSKMYSSSNQDEEGKDFRFYFDFEHLRDSASVLDQKEFWSDWGKWQKKDGLNLHLVEDFRVTPMKLTSVKDALIMRKFGDVEPDNYWYRVCEGKTESVIQRPWHLIWKSRRLLEIVSGIASKMNWDFDSVHIVRGEKAKNTELWPNLAADTSPDALLSSLRDKIDDGRQLYIATDETDTSFFDPLKDKYTTHFLDEFKELWSESSEWYAETKQLNSGIPVEFDGYMRAEVDTEVFLRGKKQIETFNDLTNDCKDGINTCRTAAS